MSNWYIFGMFVRTVEINYVYSKMIFQKVKQFNWRYEKYENVLIKQHHYRASYFDSDVHVY